MDIQAELCETITTLGGRVEEKIPRQGFILVQPGTAEEERLRICWTKPERPDRHIVPYTYVEACKIAGMLLKQIFVENGAPIGMHIHPSIANVNARSALSQRIMVNVVFSSRKENPVQCFTSIPVATPTPLPLPRESFWPTQTLKSSNISSSNTKM